MNIYYHLKYKTPTFEPIINNHSTIPGVSRKTSCVSSKVMTPVSLPTVVDRTALTPAMGCFINELSNVDLPRVLYLIYISHKNNCQKM